MVNDWHLNFNDTAIHKCEIKENENIGLVFVYIILFAASTASLLFFTLVVVEARRTKKRYVLQAPREIRKMDT